MPIDPENGEGHVDAFDESEKLEDEDLVTITDDDGNEIDCAILAVIEHNEQEYALVAPVAQLESDEAEGDDADDGEEGTFDMYILRYSVDDDGVQVFEGVEDDDEYDAVLAEFSTLIDQEADEARE
jgi:uncharacterized protein YrzB (UPF0473 family)